jgi:protein TonB
VKDDLLQEAGLPPANDRMLTTCFLAALFHAIVILGVTFSSSRGDVQGPDAPALEVVLVNERTPAAAKNPEARYLAQQTQKGSGNAEDSEHTLIPRSSPLPLERRGTPGGQGPSALENGGSAGEDELLATPAASVRILYFAAATVAPEESQAPQMLEQKPAVDVAPNDESIELRMRGASKRQRWIAADARESDVAVYLDGWRRKIERVGTLNFPDAARRESATGTPVIEVTIGANGRLLRTVVRRTSGHAEIDAAAVRILKLAAPYAPFPGGLAAQHDEIRIAYEWQFLGGASQGAGLLYAAPHD